MAQKRELILLDAEDFYGMTVDLVLFNLGQEPAFKIQTRPEYERFLKNLEAKKYQDAIYLIDEFFGSGKIELGKLLSQIKEADKGATVISYTVSAEDEIADKEKYDYIVLKTSREVDRSLINALSKIYGVEFTADNNDPERELVSKG